MNEYESLYIPQKIQGRSLVRYPHLVASPPASMTIRISVKAQYPVRFEVSINQAVILVNRLMKICKYKRARGLTLWPFFCSWLVVIW